MDPSLDGPTLRHVIELSRQPFRVVIAGGGIAGIEATLALREFAGDLVDISVIDPGARFRVPGTATGRAFGLSQGVDLRLADVVYRAGGSLVGGRIESVEPGARTVTLAGGKTLPFDALIVAVGATPIPVVPGALTFTGPADVGSVRALVDDISQRALRGAGADLAVIVPPGCGWPLAAYELALMTREHLAQLEGPAEASICIITSEETPLDVFGPVARDAVRRMLDRAAISVLTEAVVRRWSSGHLELEDGGFVRADRVIALPVHLGPAVRGLPSDSDGFISTEPDGRVSGTAGIWAVGDGTTSPVKQGGIACQQADAVAAAIAGSLGIEIDAPPAAPSLTGWMWDGRRGRRLPSGAPDSDVERGDLPPVWPVAKIGGRFLAPFLQPLVAARTLARGPIGVPA
jgi:sulfide:quinone oxidoreductase